MDEMRIVLSPDEIQIARWWAVDFARLSGKSLEDGFKDAIAAFVKIRVDGASQGIPIRVGQARYFGFLTPDGGMVIGQQAERPLLTEGSIVPEVRRERL